MPDETIKPALTAAEWEAGVDRPPRRQVSYHSLEIDLPDDEGDLGITQGNDRVIFVPVEDRHALAALALHGQGFGFTAADVARVRTAAEYERSGHGAQDAEFGDGDEAAALDNLADRINALLPPDEDG